MTQNSDISVKNYQSDKNIRMMYKDVFDICSDNINISKLSGGLKNAVYLIEDEDKKVVLKIAPKDESKMITVDRKILWWEAEMLKLMEQIDFPAPRLIHYNDRCELCESPYIFMTYISGKNYLEHKKYLTSSEIDRIDYQIGELSSKICSIKGNDFFLPAQPNKKFDNNYEFVHNLFELLLDNAKEKKINLGKYNYDNVFEILETRKDNLFNISNLCLSHTDIWDGNILIDNGSISGIVDFSDMYYCDELFTFYFHTIDGITSNNFLKGFNDKKLSHDEKVRIEIYRMYVILKMIVDCELKDYGKFDWMYQNLENRIDVIKKLKR